MGLTPCPSGFYSRSDLCRHQPTEDFLRTWISPNSHALPHTSETVKLSSTEPPLYIVECSDGTLYTDVTNNLEKRLGSHNIRKGGRYTKGRAPVTLKYIEEYRTKSQAMKREEQLKGWTRAKKIALIQGDAEKLRSLSQRKT